jgi:hypothetical protein
MTFIVTGTGPVRDLTPGEEKDARDAGVWESRTTASLVGGQDFSAVVAEWRVAFPDRYSDAAIESGAGHEAWVAFVGQAPAGVVARLQGLPIDVQVREDAAFTEVQRRGAVGVAVDELVRVVGRVSVVAGFGPDDVLSISVQDVGQGIDAPAVEALVSRAVGLHLGAGPSAGIEVRVGVQSGPVIVLDHRAEGAASG